MKDIELLKLKIQCVCLFKKVTIQTGLGALIKLINAKTESEKISAWVEYYSFLLKSGNTQSGAKYIFDLCAKDENELSYCVAAGKTPSSELISLAKKEFEIIKELATLNPSDFSVEIDAYLPLWKSGGQNYSLDDLIYCYKKFGYGVFSQSVAFTFNISSKSFEPISNINSVRLSDLKEYSEEKQVVTQNTQYFIKGLPANNVLLYGDRGTGKSSTVHAILNEYSEQGLRLIEVTKAAIPYFPLIMRQLANFSNKFIIFLDDLTFIEGADDYACLKAALEGSVGSKNPNTLIYATTNRRHLLKESNADRTDDIHANDTREEQLSLSDRFGLVVTFINPNKKEFFVILKQILADRNLYYSDDELSLKAEQYALAKGGRSPRAAHQLADILQSSNQF